MFIMGLGKIFMSIASVIAAITTTTGGVLKSMPDGSVANLSELGAVKQDIGKAIAGKDPVLGSLRMRGKKISHLMDVIGRTEQDSDTEL
jgi:hypothetical protein